MCLLHGAASTNFDVVHKEYTVQMHIPSYCINLHSQGCSLLNLNVGSEAINLQVESTVWTYYVHIFSLYSFPSVGLQCALFSRPTWLTCNCANSLDQPASLVVTQGLE